ncbi:LOW QUALITY PROTEIN: THAP domain-containing protein 8 [Artibeus jamaicensis]|uniref:LOW QUALITY PROTEIN: THAP domain-containing protein 8 n=1 Tax=Artibeus jamaicensis TaxID=9417 RepID=UPI00235A7C21|nr:LOW QUALITY PROTEIN: THAP domain-containing protein 8 [Artibeus jamaicensis]
MVAQAPDYRFTLQPPQPPLPGLPNCSNTAGLLRAENRSVRFYNNNNNLLYARHFSKCFTYIMRMTIIPSSQCMGRQHLCSKHFTPSCFQWHWGVCYLQPDSVPSIFSGRTPLPPCLVSQSNQKPVVPPQESTSLCPGPDILACSCEHLVVLGPASGDSEDAATLFLTPPPQSVLLAPTGLHPGVPSQYLQAELGYALGALLQKVQRLQQCQEQLQESQAFTIICGEPDITVAFAQGPVLPILHVKPELLDSQTPSARDQERCYWTDDRRQRKRLGPSPLPILGRSNASLKGPAPTLLGSP